MLDLCWIYGIIVYRTSRAAAWRELAASMAEKAASQDALADECAMSQAVLFLPPKSVEWQVGARCCAYGARQGCKPTQFSVQPDVLGDLGAF